MTKRGYCTFINSFRLTILQLSVALFRKAPVLLIYSFLLHCASDMVNEIIGFHHVFLKLILYLTGFNSFSMVKKFLAADCVICMKAYQKALRITHVVQFYSRIIQRERVQELDINYSQINRIANKK